MAPAVTPKMPATTTHRQRGLSRWPVGKSSGRKTTRIPIAGMNHDEATHATGTSSGESPPAAIAERSNSPAEKVTPASTPDTRRSQPITFSERRVVRTAPTRARFAGRRRKMRKKGSDSMSPRSRAAAVSTSERDERNHGDRRSGPASRRGRDGIEGREHGSGRSSPSRPQAAGAGVHCGSVARDRSGSVTTQGIPVQSASYRPLEQAATDPAGTARSRRDNQARRPDWRWGDYGCRVRAGR